MSSIDELLRHPGVWRARDQDTSSQPRGLPTGFSALDGCLPGGGWPRQGLIELLADSPGIGELSLLMPALAALCGEKHEGGWLAWVSPPYQPYAPALAACGIDINRVLVVRSGPAAWVMEQALRSGSCSAVLGWVNAIDMQSLRRLQLAAEQAGCLAVLFRRSQGIQSAVPGRVTHHAVRQAGRPRGADPEEPRRTTNQHDAALRQSPVST